MTVPANVTRFLFAVPGLDDAFRVVGFTWDEALSRCFHAELEVLCKNAALDLEALVGRPGVLTLADVQGSRYLHGEIRQMRQETTGRRFTLYRLWLVPKLQFLQFRSDLRIFQDQSVPDIVLQVLTDAGIRPPNVRLDLRGHYPLRTYCTQFRETDLALVERLLAEEGIFYFFEHSAERHCLVLSDHHGVFQPLKGQGALRFKPRTGQLAGEESVFEFESAHRIRPGKVTLRDYHFEKSRLLLEKSNQDGQFADLEDYEYPGHFSDPAEGQRRAGLRRQAWQAGAQTVSGQSDSQRLAAGLRWNLEQHPVAALNRSYLLTQVTLTGRQPQVNEEEAGNEGSGFDVRFTGMPDTLPFRPEPIPRCEFAIGCQTARVVGPVGEEIHTDQHGRIRIQFHWDRAGGYDERSSCWVRVSQASAGNQWGTQVLPRVGQEVLITFLHGDPDQPLVMGGLYNGAHQPPYALPEFKTRTTFKSLSTTGGGGFHELSMEDRKGSEGLHLHAARDLDLFVGHDWREWTGQEWHQQVQGNRVEHIGQDLQLTVGGQACIETGSTSRAIGRDEQIRISGSYLQQADQRLSLKAGMQLVIEAGVELSLRGGSGLVKLDPSGVTVQGPLVRINSGGSAAPGQSASTGALLQALTADAGDGPGQASPAALRNGLPAGGGSPAPRRPSTQKLTVTNQPADSASPASAASEGISISIAPATSTTFTPTPLPPPPTLSVGKSSLTSNDAQSVPPRDAQDDLLRSIRSKQFTPGSLPEAQARLTQRRGQIAASGYSAKYTDAELQHLAQKGDVASERFQVRFMETVHLSSKDDAHGHLSGALGLPMQGASGKGAKYWSTSFDQIEDADTDPRLIAGKLGLEYDPTRQYSLLIIDSERAAPLTGVKSVPATFEKVSEFANTELPLDFPKPFTDRVMNPAFQAEYARHYKAAVATEFLPDVWSKDVVAFENYLKTTHLDHSQIKVMKQRMLMHEKVGNNQDYMGNGLTKDLVSGGSKEFGAVETLNFERKEVNLQQLNEANAICILTGLRPL